MLVRLGSLIVVLVVVVIGARAATPQDTRPATSADASHRVPSPAKPARVDERRGTYRGVGLGSTRRQSARELGPSRAGPNEPFQPLREQGLAIGIPPAPQTPRALGIESIWRFRQVAMVTDRGRAWMIVVSASDARTRAGVGVGDTLATVRSAYSRASCGVANEGTEYVSYPYCSLRVARHRYLWFGYDPVRSLTMSRAPLI